MGNRMLVALAIVLGGTMPVGADNWPAFRGGESNTVAQGKGYSQEWGPDKNIKWRTELGDANGSPIVYGERVFVTSAEDNGKKRTLHCFDRTNGKELWSKTVRFDGNEPTHKTNPYGASTPVTDGERVIVWHGTPGVFCYNMEGEIQWSKTGLGDIDHIWGYGSSPILVRDRVILNYGPGTNTFVVALNKETGEVLWKTDEPGGSTSAKGRYIGSWSTPIVTEIEGDSQILCSMPTRVVSYDLENGNIRWTIDGLASNRSDLAYTSMMVSGDVGVAMGGFKGPALGFKLGGKGDVTESNRLWRTEKPQPQRIGTGVIVGDFIYMANAGPGTIQCLELRTGKERWVQRVQGNHWGSMVLADGLLYANNQNGTTYVFRPDPQEYQNVATNELKESTNSTPAFSDGEIFQRTSKALYCISDKNN